MCAATNTAKKPAKTAKNSQKKAAGKQPAPTGEKLKNAQFWKQYPKGGRPRTFKTAEKLWEAACTYFEWCDGNPLLEVDFRGKDAVEVTLPKMRAYTIQGLCLFLGVNVQYLSECCEGLDPKGSEYEEFSLVTTRIKNIIYVQKFEGAAAGFLNANIIARDLGLKDKSDITSDGQPIGKLDISVSFTSMEER